MTAQGRIFHKPSLVSHPFELFNARKDWEERAGLSRDNFLGAMTAPTGRQTARMPVSARLTGQDVSDVIAAIQEIVG